MWICVRSLTIKKCITEIWFAGYFQDVGKAVGMSFESIYMLISHFHVQHRVKIKDRDYSPLH